MHTRHFAGAARRSMAALAAAASALAALPAQADEAGKPDKCRLSALEIPVRMEGDRPVVTLGIDGMQVPMLLDTGAFYSLLTASAAAQLHLKLYDAPSHLVVKGLTGNVDVQATRVGKLQIGGGEIPDVEFLVGGNDIGHGTMGVMGRNLFVRADNEFDLAHGVVKLVFPQGRCEDADFAYWAGDAPVNVAPLAVNERGDTSMRVSTQVNEHRFTALLDTGAQTMLRRRTAHRADIEDDTMTPAGSYGGAGEGHAHAWTARVRKFALGGETIANNVLQVTDADGLGADMLLGVDYFLSHHIYISHREDKFYATWNGGPVFARNRDDKTAAADEARYMAPPAAASPTDADALARSGKAAAARGDFGKALEDLDRACALAPLHGAYFAARASVRLAMKDRPDGLADIDEALRLDPSDAASRLLRAQLRASAPEERASMLADLAALDQTLPDVSPLRADMGRLYARLDRPTEALRQWALWLPTRASDTARSEVFNQRCRLRARLGLDLDQALADCEEAVDENDGNPAFQDSLGWVQLRRGQAGKAIAAFDRALQRRPRWAWSLYGRGLAKATLADAAGGDADLAAARALDTAIDAKVAAEGFAPDARATPVQAAASAAVTAR